MDVPDHYPLTISLSSTTTNTDTAQCSDINVRPTIPGALDEGSWRTLTDRNQGNGVGLSINRTILIAHMVP